MFDVAITFLIQFINYLPTLICFVLILNLISDLLWGGK